MVERGKHLLSLKDNNQSDRLEALLDAGVTSFKIEGRLKDVAYVKNVTAYYSERLNDICRRNPQRYCRSSSGRCRYTFEPDPAKSFNRGFTHYFSVGRTPEGELAAPISPKSIGERVGTVVSSKGRTVAVRSDKSFANGDGFVYFDAQELKGFRANRIDGNRIETLNKLTIATGTPLYRNYDKAFADAKAMKVPPNMELKKLELISRQERSFQAMKMAKLQFEAKQKGGVADGESEDEDDADEEDGDGDEE